MEVGIIITVTEKVVNIWGKGKFVIREYWDPSISKSL